MSHLGIRAFISCWLVTVFALTAFAEVSTDSRLLRNDIHPESNNIPSSTTTGIVSAVNQCSGVYPLPFATHWTPHAMWNYASTHPRWQLKMVEKGHHWLPTFWWGDLQQPWDKQAEAYYRPAIDEVRKRKLPISLVSTQWERVLYERSPWKDAKIDDSALEFSSSGKPVAAVSPFGAIKPWSEVGRAWATTPILLKLQELYPDPPYVVLLSNNEAKKLKQNEVQKSVRYLKRFGAGQSDEFRRRILGDGYIERYRALVEGVRLSLTTWKDRAIIIGWGGTNVNFGRGSWWLQGDLPNFGLTVPGRLNITPFVWDGVAIKYYVDPTYTRNASDSTLFNPKVEIMSLPLEMNYACQQRENYYWEMTTWFEPIVEERIRKEGKVLPHKRYSGFVKFGMWIARPTAVRHFSSRDETLSDFGLSLEGIMEAVDEINQDSVLASFWKSSDLIMNPNVQHPYRTNVPPEYASALRWAALSTSLDPPRPWNLKTELPVWVLGLVQRKLEGSPRWLLLAQSPQELISSVQVEVPELGSVQIRATPSGCYYLIESRDQKPRSLDVNEGLCSMGIFSGDRKTGVPAE